MKILTIGNYSSNLTKYEAQLKQFIIMHERGYDITIMGYFSAEIESLLNSFKIPLVHAKPKNKNDVLFYTKLKNYVIKNNIDIVHVFGGNFTANTCIALKNIDVKLVGYFGSTSIYWHDILAYKTYLNKRIDAIISISENITQHLKKQLLGSKKNKVITIYKGYNTDWFSNIKSFDYSTLGIPKHATIILSAANHRPIKGMKYLMKAIQEIKYSKNIFFVFAGKNTNQKDLQNLAKKSKFKNQILLLGHRNDIKSLMKGCHIYTQTSKNEGLGRAIIESMCLKKPVVVTNAGGCTELVEDGISGYIAKNKNPKSIAQKLNILIDSEEKRKIFGLEGYKRIERIFNVEITVDKTLALYQKMLKK